MREREREKERERDRELFAWMYTAHAIHNEYIYMAADNTREIWFWTSAQTSQKTIDVVPFSSIVLEIRSLKLHHRKADLEQLQNTKSKFTFVVCAEKSQIYACAVYCSNAQKSMAACMFH